MVSFLIGYGGSKSVCVMHYVLFRLTRFGSSYTIPIPIVWPVQGTTFAAPITLLAFSPI